MQEQDPQQDQQQHNHLRPPEPGSSVAADAVSESEAAALLQEDPDRLRRVTFSDQIHVPEAAESSSNGEYANGSSMSSSQPARSWWRQFKDQVKALKWEVLALYYAAHDPRTPWLSRLVPLLAVAYALSPLDLIPDFVPVLGLLDDLIILPVLIWVSLKLIPKQVMADARDKAEEHPVRLSQHWPMAVCIFSSWVALLLLCVHMLVQRYGDEHLVEYEWAALAGAGGLATLGFTVFIVRQLRFESRSCDQWNAALLSAPTNEEPV